jgi:hypothetical protein
MTVYELKDSYTTEPVACEEASATKRTLNIIQHRFKPSRLALSKKMITHTTRPG